MKAAYEPAAGEDRIRALSEMLRQRGRGLENFARRCLAIRGAQPQAADVQDVIAEAYLRAATRLTAQPNLEIANLDAWFRKVLYFVCLRQANDKYRLDLSATLDEFETEDDALETSYANQILLDQLLERLDPDEKEVLLMVRKGYKSSEIGQMVGKSPDNVRQIKSRAIGRLKRSLKEA